MLSRVTATAIRRDFVARDPNYGGGGHIGGNWRALISDFPAGQFVVGPPRVAVVLPPRKLIFRASEPRAQTNVLVRSGECILEALILCPQPRT